MNKAVDTSKLIFIGGEAGVGKSTVSRQLQAVLGQVTQIDKDEVTAVLVNALLMAYGCESSDRESVMYLRKVKPLEYQQLDNIVLNNTGNDSMIITAPFFDAFLDDEWKGKMRQFGAEQNREVHFLFLTRNAEDIHRGLMSRNAARDAWKLAHYNDYRRATDNILKAISNVDDVKHIAFEKEIDTQSVLDGLVQKMQR